MRYYPAIWSITRPLMFHFPAIGTIIYSKKRDINTYTHKTDYYEPQINIFKCNNKIKNYI